MGYAGFEVIRYLRDHAAMVNEFKPKLAHLQRANYAINTNLNIALPLYFDSMQSWLTLPLLKYIVLFLSAVFFSRSRTVP